MNAVSLAVALRAAGMACAVEAIDRLAVLTPDDRFAERSIVEGRREALRLSRAHGFTHLALELPRDPADGAPLHRD